MTAAFDYYHILKDYGLVLGNASALDGACASPRYTPQDLFADLRSGNQLRKLDRYDLEEPLGIGGMGCVIKASRKFLGKVAVKLIKKNILYDDSEVDEELYARMVREMSLGLDHPNIVQVRDGDTCNGRPYLVMEYLEGEDLRTKLKKEVKLPADQACRVVCDVATGLHHCHNKKVIHRDIKPANIFLTSEGRAKILDLGLAFFVDGSGKVLTSVGRQMGTPHYREEGHTEADFQWDIYSLGCTLHDLLTGDLPESFSFERKWEHQDVPAGLRALIAKMVYKPRNERYQTAGEVADRLQAFFFAPHPRPSRLFRVSRGGRALAIGAHWDDVLVGCLGTLLRLKREHGYQVAIEVLCNSYEDCGQTVYYSEHGQPIVQPHLHRAINEAYDAVRRLGIEVNIRGTHQASIPNRGFKECAATLDSALCELASKYADWDMVFTPPRHDRHEDHRQVGEGVFKHFAESKAQSILEYPVKDYAQGPDFRPNLLIGLDGNGQGSGIVPSLKEVADVIVRDVPGAYHQFGPDRIMGRLRANVGNFPSCDRIDGEVYGEVFQGEIRL